MVASVTAKALREQRKELVLKAQKLHDERAENWTNEDETTFNAIWEEANALEDRAKRSERIETATADLDRVVERVERQSQSRSAGNDGASLSILCRQVGAAGYVSRPVGKRGSAEYRDQFANYLGGVQGEYAALQSDNDAQAGYLVASEQFASELLKNVDDLNFIRRLATVYQVREASSLGIRKRTAKANTFGWGAEIQAPTADSTLAYGKRSLTPHYMAGEITVSRDLLRRAVIGVEQIVREELAMNAADLEEDAFLTGTGDQQPLGLFTASSDGISTARDVAGSNTTTAIAADTLRDMKYALKTQYRDKAAWLFHRDAIKAISKLKDADNQYLWQPGITANDPDSILGRPVYESENVPNTFTAGLYVGMLGDFSRYYIADALDLELLRLDELNARTNQVTFIGRMKTDGMPVLEEAFVRMKLAAS